MRGGCFSLPSRRTGLREGGSAPGDASCQWHWQGAAGCSTREIKGLSCKSGGCAEVRLCGKVCLSKELGLPALVTGSSHGLWCPLSASPYGGTLGGADKQSCGTSLCFTAKQDNNHCTQSQPLPQRQCVPCWGVPWAVVGLQAWGGCSGSHGAAESHRGHGQAGGAPGGCMGDWELAAPLTPHCAPARGLEHDSPSLGKEQGDSGAAQGSVDPSGSAPCPVLG